LTPQSADALTLEIIQFAERAAERVEWTAALSARLLDMRRELRAGFDDKNGEPEDFSLARMLLGDEADTSIKTRTIRRALSRGITSIPRLTLACGIILLRETNGALRDKEARDRTAFFLCNFTLRHAGDLLFYLSKKNPWIDLGNLELLGADDPSETSQRRETGTVTSLRKHKQVAFIDLETRDGLKKLRGPARIARDVRVGDHLVVKCLASDPAAGGKAIPIESLVARVRGCSRTALSDEWAPAKLEAECLAQLRQGLLHQGFVEVRSRLLTDSYEGGDARPFITFENARGQTQYLRSTSELWLTKYIACGAEAVFEIGPSFRNETPRGRPTVEFAMLEAYCTNLELAQLVDAVTRLFCTYVGETAEVASIRFEEAFALAAGFPASDRKRCMSLAESAGVAYPESLEPVRLQRHLFKQVVIPRLTRTCLISHIPGHASPFVKVDAQGAQRLWLCSQGLSIAEFAESETDPLRVWQRLHSQFQVGRAGVRRDYRALLEQLYAGLPRTVGFGLGVERMTRARLRRTAPV
jgi:elongation factor P--beta-lysine ligase